MACQNLTVKKLCMYLKNVATDASWYLPSQDSRTESHVFARSNVSQEKAPAVFALGEGWLGYTGNVNSEQGSDAVLLGMCGLL